MLATNVVNCMQHLRGSLHYHNAPSWKKRGPGLRSLASELKAWQKHYIKLAALRYK